MGRQDIVTPLIGKKPSAMDRDESSPPQPNCPLGTRGSQAAEISRDWGLLSLLYDLQQKYHETGVYSDCSMTSSRNITRLGFILTAL
ncbi:hypothetical protein PoB_003213000 [Plakobranchus ocellatus]|uniref:Uncharacterized protein n=1 Tax=Plakobranchus ocellatus TaxID=259542 RepID=A0AAV4AFT7_9GAST|nr:hypothetical protein PoB_003213000 [Plakobranchus ocellatus]